MLSSVLSLPLDTAQKLDLYAIKHSSSLESRLVTHLEWTRDKFEDADRSSSVLQAQWMASRARDLQAKRVLDIGCYTGLSALAWYIGTEDTDAQILTVEKVPELAAVARDILRKSGCDDRIKVLEGSADVVLAHLSGSFDIIFVDLDFSAYQPIVEQVLERGLLSSGGVMIVDNVFARGFVVDPDNLANIDPQRRTHWIEAGHLMLLPFFDGISEIRVKV